MGQQASSLWEGDNAVELVSSDNPDDVPETSEDPGRSNRSRSCMVSILSEKLRVHNDLTHSLHQLAELGNTEAIKIKLKEGDVNKLDGDQLSPLHYAARYNHIETVKALLENNADVNIRGQDERTPLHYAARCRVELRHDSLQLENGTSDENKTNSMVILLKASNADVNAQDKYGQTPLHFAAMTGNLSAAQDLVQFCLAKVQIEDTHQMTPLIMAATHGHLEMVQLFLDQLGTDIRCADASKQTALHHAAKGGHLSVVQLLIKMGRDMKNFRDFLDGKDHKQKTPLYHAASNGHVQVACQLLSEGADVDAVTITMATPLHAAAGVGNVDIITLLLKHNVQLDVRDLFQRTPLMFAASGNHTDAISLLLKRGADISHRDLNQATALLLAAQNGHAAAIQLLLKMKAEPKVVDKLDKSAIFHCAEQGKIEALQVLLKSKQVPYELIDEVDCYGRSPLHIAVLKGHMEAMMLLLKNGAVLDTKNEEQDTVLHLAARKGCVSMIQELLPNSYAMLNAENEDLDTPLHLACKWGQEEVVRLLLEAGADVTSTNSSSSTPLHLAASKGHLGCCQLLVDSDAHLDMFNKDYKTPLMLAVLEDHVGVTRLLLEHGASLAAASTSQMNALELAVDAGKRDIALAIVQSSGWEDGMKRISEDYLGNRVTPFRRMIEKLPRVAEEVLNRCIKTSAKTSEFDEPEQSINFEYLDDTYQCGIRGVTQFDAEGKLMAKASRYSTDARVVKKNHPLRLMIKRKLPMLLSHPVCVTLIKHKWVNYGRWVYYSNFALYVIFLLSLTAYVISTRNFNWIDANKTDAIVEFRDAKDCEEVDWNSWKVYILLTVCKWVVVILACVEIIKEISQVYQARTAYLCVENLLEWVCYVCAVLFVYDFHECPNKEAWQWQLGATAIFLSWINLLLFIRVFPFFGIYVIMFTQVLITFSSFFLLFFFFIIAFALSFYTVLGDQYAFRTPSLSLLRTSVMMIGEINYEEVFNNPSQPLEYPEVTYILLIGFLIFMSILIMNLLVGLAVDDIKAVQEQAMLQKLAMQTEMVLDIEMVIPDFMKRKYILREMKVMNERHRGVLGAILSKLNINQGREVSEVEELRREVQQLKQSVNSLMEVTSSLNDLAVLKASVGDLGQLTARLASNIQNNQQHNVPSPTTPSTEAGVWQGGIDF